MLFCAVRSQVLFWEGSIGFNKLQEDQWHRKHFKSPGLVSQESKFTYFEILHTHPVQPVCHEMQASALSYLPGSFVKM